MQRVLRFAHPARRGAWRGGLFPLTVIQAEAA
jgi:hypothetical protein